MADETKDQDVNDNGLDLVKVTDGVFNAGAALITYSNCRGLRHNDVVEFYHPDPYRDLLYLAVEEVHESGEPHVHIYMERTEKSKIKGNIKTRFDIWLDVSGQRRKYHPNIEKVKNKKDDRIRIIKYLLKFQNYKAYLTPEQKFLTNMPEQWIKQAIMEMEMGVMHCKKDENGWLLALKVAEQGDFFKAEKIIRDNYPKDYTINREKILDSLRAQYIKPIKVRDLNTFEIPLGVKEWMDGKYPDRSLYIWGQGDAGKTQLAKAVAKFMVERQYPDKNYTFLSCHGNLETLKTFNEIIHRAIIFDDIDVTTKNPEDIIHLISQRDDSSVKMRYRNIDIPVVWKIFCHNKDFNEWIPAVKDTNQLNAILRRVCIVRIPPGKKLYKTNEGIVAEDNTVQVVKYDGTEIEEKHDDEFDSAPTLIAENSQPLILPNDDDDFWQPVVPESIQDGPSILNSVIPLDSDDEKKDEDQIPTLKRKPSNSPEQKQNNTGWFTRQWKYSKDKLKLKKKFL